MKGTILVIDDEKKSVDEICKLLNSFEYATYTIPEHEFLLKELEDKRPDLILMDINMPVTDGISLLIALKASEKNKAIPVVMMTAHADDTTLGLCFDHGADDFINKPIEAHILKARVKSVIQNGKFVQEIKRKNIEIEEQNKDIIESIKYGQTIQQALFHTKERVLEIFPKSCLFFRPRQIVSGDFYWVAEVNGKKFIAVGDCTGHGVPGAFMSMLGYSLMNQIVINEKQSDPASILNLLHQRVRTSLKQDEHKNNDGMDIGLCVYDTEKRTLQFAGAYNLLFVANGEDSTSYSGDKFPIGGMHHRFKGERNFQTKDIELQPGLGFYMYSDGFPDQFGGENGRKFMKKYLHELLITIHQLPFDRQEEELESHLLEWRGDHKQIDDVIVLGFSVD